MHATVAICTWNRCESLRRTLARMCRMRIPPTLEWELIVVNNNCTDATDEVIDALGGRLPVRRVFEPKQGLSNARNAAISAAHGDLIVFTDDDVLVEPGWLAAYVDAAGRWPEAAYFGGVIEPEFECEPPEWVKANLQLFRNMFGVRDFGPQEREFRGGEAPFGGNMAFRLQVLRRWQFDPNFGRSGNGRIMADETAVFGHLSENGSTGIWLPEAKLKHFVPRQSFSRKYIWDYFYGQGRTSIRLHGTNSARRLWGVPRYQLRQFCTARLRAWLLQCYNKKGWIKTFAKAASTRGAIDESRAARRKEAAAHRHTMRRESCPTD